MEEKKKTKIKLSTVYLILSIIAIIALGMLVYKLSSDNANEIKKSTELQSQINSLNQTVNDLQRKTENNNINNTVVNQSNSDNSNTNNTNTVTENSIKSNNNNNNSTSSPDESKGNSNNTNKLVKTARPSGFSGSSLHEVRLYSNGDVYLITFSDGGYVEDKIIDRKLIAKNVENIESGEETRGEVVLSGKNIEEIYNEYGWIIIQEQ